MVKVSNIKISYHKPILDGVSFLLGGKEKVGLIGLNGSGKSTLFRIIMGQETPDEGKVEITPDEIIAYLPQEYSFDKNLLAGEILESFVPTQKEIYKVQKILAELNVSESNKNKKMGETIPHSSGTSDIDWYIEAEKLSYGQKMKIYLTKLLINNPTFLLMDEPTNHLDITGIRWLETFIKNFKGRMMIISHDRAFLNEIATKIFEIDEMKLNVFEGNYDNYVDAKIEWIEDRETRLHLQQKRKEKLENLIAKIRLQKAGTTQGKRLKAAKTRMDREVTTQTISKYREEKIKDINLKGESYKTKTVLKITDLCFEYSKDKVIFDNASTQIFGNDKVWFQGTNGIGKSTLVKIITGELKQKSGTIEFGENVRWTYFSQDQSSLKYDYTVERYFLESTNVDMQKSFGILQKFLFTKDMRNMLISDLSPGQRARLIFAVFAQHEYDFLILDEPTNHLDIKSKEVIEDALREYKGAMLLISHDRYFVENLEMNKSLYIQNKKLVIKEN